MVALLLLVSGCDSSTPRSTSSTGAHSESEADHASVALHGIATLDGANFDARWIGAVVIRDRLLTPCNTSLPRIQKGRFAIRVYAERVSAGCGGPGTAVLFWTFANETKLYATAAIPWAEATQPASVARVRFSSAHPQGAAPVVTELDGHVLNQDGSSVRRGRVEARIDGHLCGVASIRDARDFVGYILSIVGPDAVPACRAGGTVTLTVDGTPARQSAINSPDHTMDLDLTIEARPGGGSEPSRP